MSLEYVKAFYKKLASDEVFRTQIQGVKTKEECSQIVKAAGYDFTLEEYEEYTTQLLELAPDEGDFKDLSEKELEAISGGFIGPYKPQPLYGVVRWPPIKWPPNGGIQPLYGVVRPE